MARSSARADRTFPMSGGVSAWVRRKARTRCQGDDNFAVHKQPISYRPRKNSDMLDWPIASTRKPLPCSSKPTETHPLQERVDVMDAHRLDREAQLLQRHTDDLGRALVRQGVEPLSRVKLREQKSRSAASTYRRFQKSRRNWLSPIRFWLGTNYIFVQSNVCSQRGFHSQTSSHNAQLVVKPTTAPCSNGQPAHGPRAPSAAWHCVIRCQSGAIKHRLLA
jgi:hypothetical protein